MYNKTKELFKLKREICIKFKEGKYKNIDKYIEKVLKRKINSMKLKMKETIEKKKNADCEKYKEDIEKNKFIEKERLEIYRKNQEK